MDVTFNPVNARYIKISISKKKITGDDLLIEEVEVYGTEGYISGNVETSWIQIPKTAILSNFRTEEILNNGTSVKSHIFSSLAPLNATIATR